MSPYPSSKYRRNKGPTVSMDSFVDFESGQRSSHRMGISSPFSYFRIRKKSSTLENSNVQPQLTTARSMESLDTYKASRSRALPPIPRLASDPSGLPGASLQGTYAPLRLSPQSNLEFDPNSIRPVNPAGPQTRSFDNYDGLPNPYDPPAPVLRANHGPPVSYPNAPQPPSNLPSKQPSNSPSNPLDAAVQRNGQQLVDVSHALDRQLAPSILLAEGLQQTPEERKVAVAKLGEMIAHGTQSLSHVQGSLDTFAESPVWEQGKEIAKTMLEPAKDMVVILDAVSAYMPMLLIAKSIFTTIINKELDKQANDKGIVAVCVTVTSFYYSLCDLKVVFEMPLTIHDAMEKFINEVNEKMKELGNFHSVYSKHGHIARTVRSGTYKNQIAGYVTAFKDFQEKLQLMLTEASALTINKVNDTVNNLSQKVDVLLEIVSQKTQMEERLSAKMEAFGGEERALKNPRFLGEAENELGVKFTPQIKAILRNELSEQLSSNMAMFQLEIKQSQKEIEQSIERSTDKILMQMESGPHELIQDEDIRQIWKDMKWRLSCKTRHFVDALHHHFANIFAKHRKTTGEGHPDQWTLKLIGRVVFQSSIGDAVDTDGSGYVSVHEVNHLLKERPARWSVPVTLAYAAAGWYLDSLVYRARCMDYFNVIRHCAKRMLRPNRDHLKPYFQKGGLPELWYIIESLNTDMLKYQGENLQLQFENLAHYREIKMHGTLDRLQEHLEAVRYHIDSPEGVNAILSTSRTERLTLPLLSLLLERHARIIEIADSLILDEREFENMITSVQNVAYAFGMRYSNLTEGWRQQRLDVPLQIQCFANGIFESWHEHFSRVPYDQEYPHPHSQYPNIQTDVWSATRSTLSGTSKKPPHRTTDFLIYKLPAQPSADKLRQLRQSAGPPSRRQEDSRVKERYNLPSQRVRAKTIRHSMRRSGAPRSPIPPSPSIKINNDGLEGLSPDPRHLPKLKVPDAIPFSSEFDDSHLMVNDGDYSDSSDLPDVPHTITKSRTLTLDDRIRSVETELNGMKDMLAQLLALSTKQST